ncbi:MAG: DUF4347 domain-containing protein [Desmonostoc vinosum HA7617-LM4]|nr:DUF4347 domain-containing protein [Desmonostoc vinosum HA7617-LM4]
MTIYPTQDLYQQQPTERLVFIDPQVEDYQSLVAGVLPNTCVVILNTEQDSIEEISQVLASHQEINSLHIVSHGAPGCIYLGNSQLSYETINCYTEQLMGWANALSANAQLLLYGCEVAHTQQGMALIERLSELTGAVVAASDDLTGSAALGGDWELEVSTGEVVAPLAFEPEVMAAYSSVLSVVLPDISFDGDGIVKTGFGGVDIGNSIVVQTSNGKIIVAGESSGNLAVARYLVNGTLDNTFDGDG